MFVGGMWVGKCGQKKLGAVWNANKSFLLCFGEGREREKLLSECWEIKFSVFIRAEGNSWRNGVKAALNCMKRPEITCVYILPFGGLVGQKVAQDFMKCQEIMFFHFVRGYKFLFEIVCTTSCSLRLGGIGELVKWGYPWSRMTTTTPFIQVSLHTNAARTGSERYGHSSHWESSSKTIFLFLRKTDCFVTFAESKLQIQTRSLLQT